MLFQKKKCNPPVEDINGKFQWKIPGGIPKIGEKRGFPGKFRGGGYGKFEDVMENFNGKFQGVY